MMEFRLTFGIQSDGCGVVWWRYRYSCGISFQETRFQTPPRNIAFQGVMVKRRLADNDSIYFLLKHLIFHSRGIFICYRKLHNWATCITQCRVNKNVPKRHCLSFFQIDYTLSQIRWDVASYVRRLIKPYISFIYLFFINLRKNTWQLHH